MELCNPSGEFNLATLTRLSCDLETVPHLSEKMLVDLVNGNEVGKDLLESKRRQTKLGRFFGWLDGSNQRREQIIQQHNQASIEALTSWTLDLVDTMRATQENAVIVANKLQQTRDDLLSVAQAVCCHADKIDQIQRVIEALVHKVKIKAQEAEKRFLNIEDKQEILELTEAWKSGRYYGGYPLTVQMAFVVDDLIRGERGKRILSSRSAKGFLLDRIINIATEKYPELTSGIQSLTTEWLPQTLISDSTKSQLASYGLMTDSTSPLHNVFAEYIQNQQIPFWLSDCQENGELRELVKFEGLAEVLIDEAGRSCYA